MIKIKNLPLYWRFLEKPAKHSVIPSTYDFVFDFDASREMIIEKRDQKLNNILDNIYKENANIGYMLDGHNLSLSYGKDYIDFINRVLGTINNKKIIDVGCGGCVILEKLKLQGAEVIGVDPSPVALEASKKKNINLINNFFSPGLMDGYSADAIIQMDVFEHIYDPLQILKSESKALSDNGFIIINVPNCEFSVMNGDISMAIHQHVNMFTRYSICKLVEDAGLNVSSLELSNYGSAIFCAATKKKTNIKSKDFFYQTQWSKLFFSRATKRIEQFKNFYEKNLSHEENIGLYIFQRCLPYLSAIGVGLKKFRYFDNNVLWHKKYLDGVPNLIENINDFFFKPPSKTLVLSETFGSAIKKQILQYDKNLSVYINNDIFIDDAKDV